MDLTRTLAVAIDPTGARAGGAQAEAAFRGVGNAAKGAENSSKSFTSSLLSLRNIIAVLGLGSLVRELYQTDVAMFRLQNQLKASSGGAEEFRRNFDFLRSTAAKLGLDMRSTGDSFGQFVASAKGKLTGSQIREAFTAISEASTAMGLSSDQTSGAIVALSQMLSKGTVSAQELRQQLGDRLPGAFKMAADAMERTEKEMNKALDTGTLMADELVPKLAKRMHEIFGPQAAEGAKSLSAEMNRLKTAWLEVQMVFLSEGGESLFSRAIKGAKEAMSDFRDWLAGMFEAGREGRLSEAVAASLRVGFGRAANYFGGFVKTAAEMLSSVGASMFTAEYFKALLGSFQSVAAGFGLAFLEALQKPLAYVQAFFENLFDRVINAGRYAGVDSAARKDIAALPQFKEHDLANPTSRAYYKPGFMRSASERAIIADYEKAISERTIQLKREIGDRTISERADAIMASGGPRFGFSGTGQTVEELKKANNESLQFFIEQAAKGAAEASSAALGKLKDFRPLNSVDTSADEALLAGFTSRSGNPFLKAPTGGSSDSTPFKDKTYWSEIKRGIDEARASLQNLYDQSFKVGTDAVGAVSRGFTGFFDSIIDGTESVIGAFKKMTASILSDIAKIIAQRLIAEPLAGAITGAFGGIFGGAGSAAKGIGSGVGAAAAGFGHTGGLIGSTLLSQKLVDPSVFNYAPRLHSGLRPDEFPAILQRGEEVIPRGGRGGGGVSMSMPITVNVDGGRGGTPEQNQKFGAEIARQIQGVIDERIARAVMPRGVLSAVRA